MSLRPMMLRHGVFDCTFFTSNSFFENLKSSDRFCIAAATASFTNLFFDIWKTQQMTHAPHRVAFGYILSSFTVSRFISNYAVKGADLSANWYVTGLVKDNFFT
jgi:hypothetical protein